MKPADIGSWGLLQVVQGGGRLLRQHFGNFWPAIVMGILPACFINVVYAQIRLMDFVSPPGIDTQGSTEETASMFRYAYLFLQPLVMAVSNLFILVGGMLMFDELTNVVYNSHVAVDTTTTRHTESLLVSMKTRFGREGRRDSKSCVADHNNREVVVPSLFDDVQEEEAQSTYCNHCVVYALHYRQCSQ